MDDKKKELKQKESASQSFSFKWWISAFALVLGCLTGWYSARGAQICSQVWNLFFALFKMCIVPVICCLIVSVMSKLNQKEIKIVAVKLVRNFIVIAIFVSTLAVVLSVLFLKFSGSTQVQKQFFSETVEREVDLGSSYTEVEYSSAERRKETSKLEKALTQVIPSNVFYALTYGDVLKILIFALALGLVLRHLNDENIEVLSSTTEGLFISCKFLINKLSMCSPIILFAFGAVQGAGFQDVRSPGIYGFMGSLAAIYGIIIGIVSILMWRELGGSYFRQFSVLKRALLLSLGLNSSMGCIPLAVEDLQKFNSKRHSGERIALAVPVSFCVCSYGLIIMLSAMAGYAVLIYSTGLGLGLLALIVLLSILASFTVIGLGDAALYESAAVVLAALTFPSSTFVVVLVAIGFVMMPVIRLTDAYIGMFASLRSARK